MQHDDVMNLAEQAYKHVMIGHNRYWSLYRTEGPTEAELVAIVGQFAWLVFNEVRNEKVERNVGGLIKHLTTKDKPGKSGAVK